MAPNDLRRPLGNRRQARNKVSPLRTGLAIHFTFRLDRDETAQVLPSLFFAQPLGSCHAQHPSRFPATVSLFHGFVQRGSALLILRLFLPPEGIVLGDEDSFDFRVEGWLIVLQRQDVIGPFLADLPGNLFLGSHGVDRDDTSLDIEQFQQLGDCGYLIRLLVDLHLSERLSVVRRPRSHQVKRTLSPTPLMRAAQRFAVNRHHLAIGRVPNRISQATKHFLNSCGSRRANTRPNVS